MTALATSLWPVLRLLGDHLWQSTVFGGVALLLTLALRKNHASVRFWVWFAASMKFFVPLAVLVALGSYIPWKSTPAAFDTTAVFFDTLSQPFSQTDLVVSPAPIKPSLDWWSMVAIGMVAIWMLGAVSVLVRWFVQWRRVLAVARTAELRTNGREHDLLRCLESRCEVTPLPLRISDTTLEPGVVGVTKPVLLWPRSLSARLTDIQIEAILIHELSHVHRWDNLTAALHMLVEALFWFHPMVWWIGARLVDERERACDEQVMHLGGEAETYAESILRTCEHYAESPLTCISGVTGSDLKRRIEAIMRHTARGRLTVSRKMMLGVAGLLAVLTPVAVGARAPHLRAQTPPTSTAAPHFEVASIRENKSGGPGASLIVQPGGRIVITDAPLDFIIPFAYQILSFQIIGAPDWLKSAHFDIQAKAPSDPQPALSTAPGTPRIEALMMRSLLRDRFKLSAHIESRVMPIYALMSAREDKKLGPKLTVTQADCAAFRASGQPPAPWLPGGPPPRCSFARPPWGHWVGESQSMAFLATVLSLFLNRVAVDRTQLPGFYDFTIDFLPDNLRPRAPGSPVDQPIVANGQPIDPNAPPLMRALEEQLGLKLESTKGPVDMLVIDHIERPSDNDSVTAPQVPTSPSPLRFEAASVKINRSNVTPTMLGFPPNGRFRVSNELLWRIVGEAYRTNHMLWPFEVLGIPDSMSTQRFDIEAVATGNPTMAERRLMLRALLEDRFKLKVHLETRELPVYFLKKVHPDGRLGNHIRVSHVDCSSARAGGPPPPPLAPGQPSPCVMQFGKGRLNGDGRTMDEVADAFTQAVERRVIDRTGLEGAFQWTLEWTPDAVNGAANPDGISIFTAVQEQLGLKLESGKAPGEVLIIDHADMPTEN
jgi:uncharacterized protein (TIGR03435 family)